MSQGQEKENPVFIITSVEIPLLEHVSLILACNSHYYTYTLTYHQIHLDSPRTCWGSTVVELLGFSTDASGIVELNVMEQMQLFFLTVNFIQNLIWLCNEMYVVNIWFCSFFILLHSSFKGVPERGSELSCNLVDKLLISI